MKTIALLMMAALGTQIPAAHAAPFGDGDQGVLTSDKEAMRCEINRKKRFAQARVAEDRRKFSQGDASGPQPAYGLGLDVGQPNSFQSFVMTTGTPDLSLGVRFKRQLGPLAFTGGAAYVHRFGGDW